MGSATLDPALRIVGTSRPTRPFLFVAALAALPGVVHAVRGGAFLADDWTFLTARASEEPGAWLRFGDLGNRPFQALIHLLQFSLLGEAAWAHALTLAAVGAVVAALMAVAVGRWTDPGTGLAAAVAWALLANISTIRFWASTTPSLVALALVLGTAVCLQASKPRTVVAVTLGVASVFTYEAGAVLVLALLTYDGWRRAPARLSGIAARTTPVLIALAWNVASSPKAATAAMPLENALATPTALFGAGLLPPPLRPLEPLLLLGVLAGACSQLVPRLRTRALLTAVIGLGVAGLGMAIIVAGVGFRVTGHGLLDRGNVFASPGVALFLAGVGRWLYDRRPPLARVLGAGAVLALGGANLYGSVAVTGAGSDLDDALRAVLTIDIEEEVLVFLPVRDGYQAGFDHDLMRLAALRGHDVPRTWILGNEQLPFEPTVLVTVLGDRVDVRFAGRGD
jgi:hypothetical protein